MENVEVPDEALTSCEGPVGVHGQNGANTYKDAVAKVKADYQKRSQKVFSVIVLPGDVV